MCQYSDLFAERAGGSGLTVGTRKHGLLGIFPRGTGPQDKLHQHNDRINAILAQCKLPRTTYANINRRFLDSSGKLLPGISRDNLHFTEKGYAIWADAVLPYIKKYCK